VSDLVEFLLARIVEDEAAARACWGDDQAGWWHHTGGEHVADDDGATVCEAVMSDEAVHIARWDPARILAECAAKRAIIARCCRVCDELDVHPNGLVSARAVLARQVLADLAQPYADHPEFNQPWRSDTPR